MTPETSASISFMIFIASMMHTVWPDVTRDPTLHVRIGARLGRPVVRADHRRVDFLERQGGRGGLGGVRRRGVLRRGMVPGAWCTGAGAWNTCCGSGAAGAARCG